MKQIDKLINGYKNIVFLDFEGSQYSQEIIAIGAIKCTLDAKNNIKEVSKGFKVYCKINSKVGRIVTELTGINDELLEKEGLTFKESINKFERYVGKEDTKFIQYGNFDMHLLHNSQVFNNLESNKFIQRIYKNHIDLGGIISQYIRKDKGHMISLLDACKIFNLNIEGEEHDPLSDSINLMNVYNAFLKEKGILRKEYMNYLGNANYPNPIRKVLKKIMSDQKVTLKDLETYIDEELK